MVSKRLQVQPKNTEAIFYLLPLTEKPAEDGQLKVTGK